MINFDSEIKISHSFKALILSLFFVLSFCLVLYLPDFLNAGVNVYLEGQVILIILKSCESVDTWVPSVGVILTEGRGQLALFLHQHIILQVLA